MATHDIGISRLAQVAVTVRDLDRATAFYRDVLGLPFLFAAPPSLAFFQAGATRLMLTVPSEGERVASHPALYYGVDDLAAAFDAVTGRGAPVMSAPKMIAKIGDREVWLAAVEDPDGHMVGLMSEVPAT